MKQTVCWEEKLSQVVVDAINHPDQEQVIVEEIIEFVLAIAANEFERGYVEGFQEKLTMRA